MKLAAYVLGIISTVCCSIVLIPLAWMIPMVIHVNKARKGECTLSTGFKVCFLLFCNLIGGILLLCDDEK